jgi:hypothetical protein
VREPGDAAAVLADFAVRADRRAEGIQWSFRRDFSGVRVVVIDSRSGRVLDGERLMVGEAEWQWVTESVAGDWDHVVLATSLPLLLPPGIHDLEAWNEAVCGGAWGQRPARAGERLRRAGDLEHWAAFGRSFGKFERLLAGVRKPRIRWRITRGPWFHNMLSALEFDGRRALIRFDRTVSDPTGAPHLQSVAEADLS